MADATSAPQPYSPADAQYVGLHAGRKTIKHTIMAKPRETAILIAALIVIIVLISAAWLYTTGKAAAKEQMGSSRGGHPTMNSGSMGNNHQNVGVGNEMGQESVQRDEGSPVVTKRPVVWWDAGTTGDALYASTTDDERKLAVQAQDVARTNQVHARAAFQFLEQGASPQGAALQGMLGSACEMPTQEAREDLAALEQVGAPIDTIGYGKNEWTATPYLR